jgi:hypothetical protein
LDLTVTRAGPGGTCQNFLALCASNYYNGTIFHRNIKGFMIQGGDPTGARPPTLTYGRRTAREINVHSLMGRTVGSGVDCKHCHATPASPNPSKRCDVVGGIVLPTQSQAGPLQTCCPAAQTHTTTNLGHNPRARVWSRPHGLQRPQTDVEAVQHQTTDLHFALYVALQPLLQ